MNKQYLVTTTGVLLIVIFVTSAIFYNSQKTSELTAEAQKNASALVRNYSPAMGNENAKVTIVEFFDPACGTCKNFYPFVKQLMAANPDKIKLVMRYTPLHRGSDEVVKILEAAHLQNKFWEILEETYATQSAWVKNHNAQPQILWKILTYSGLDIEKARKDVQNPDITQRIQQDISDANQLQVDKTPGFFVNGKPLVNFGYEQLQVLVENELRNNY